MLALQVNRTEYDNEYDGGTTNLVLKIDTGNLDNLLDVIVVIFFVYKLGKI